MDVRLGAERGCWSLELGVQALWVLENEPNLSPTSPDLII